MCVCLFVCFKEKTHVFSAPDNGVKEYFSTGLPVFYYAGQSVLWLKKQNLHTSFPSS